MTCAQKPEAEKLIRSTPLGAAPIRFVQPAPAVRFTRHALERLREHHDVDDFNAARDQFAIATEIDVTKAIKLLRRDYANKRSIYLLARDHRGVFVLDKNTNEVVTYLRLDSIQMNEAAKQWGKPLA